MDRRTVRVNLFDVNMRWEADICWTLPDLISWAQEMLDSVPGEFRDTARFGVDFEPGGYDDGDYCHVRVYYDRPQTDEELAGERDRKAEFERQHRADMERRYEELARALGKA